MLLRLESITRTYEMGQETIFALDNISWSMDTNEYVAITGSSGSGKSTLMNVIGCLDTPSRGHYFFHEKELSACKADELATFRNSSIGFVFQNFNLIAFLNAEENVMLPLRYAGMSQEESRIRARNALARVGLGNRGNSRPNQLSGGQQQRVAIARALVSEPRLILADEPTGALDSRNTSEILGMFDELVANGVALVVVTHDQQVASRAKRVVRLADGKIVSDQIQTSTED